MYYCINDKSRTYKGTEPSPKGLGYCAHAEKIDSKKKGKDGNIWIVSITKNKIKRWIKLKNNLYETVSEGLEPSKYGEKAIFDKVIYFINSDNCNIIIYFYYNFLKNEWELSNKILNDIKYVIYIIKCAIYAYLTSYIDTNSDLNEILNTNKWNSYKDTLPRDFISELIYNHLLNKKKIKIIKHLEIVSKNLLKTFISEEEVKKMF